jgi:hypothetical protein
VKYEGLGDPPAPHRPRYDEIAAAMGCFRAQALERLQAKPLQQIWRDHLLVGSLLLDRAGGYADGFFAFLHPKDNERCARACRSVRGLSRRRDELPAVDARGLRRRAPRRRRVEAFASRYLDFGRLERPA